MTQEEKQLLLKDITARLSYGLKVQIDFGEHCIKYDIDRYVDDAVICVWPETFEIGVNDEDQACDIEDVKPYLRTMSSMTEEEAEEYNDLVNELSDYDYKPEQSASKMVDWLNKKKFDYCGLIPMGLALEATEEMYNNKTEQK